MSISAILPIVNVGTLKFKVAKNITLPQLKMDDQGTPIYVKIVGKIFKSVDTEKQAAAKAAERAAGKTVMENPEIFQAINLETGEEVEVIAGTVLSENLNAAYPEGTYVGKCFQISKTKVQGKRYSLYKLAEIELLGDETSSNQAAKPNSFGSVLTDITEGSEIAEIASEVAQEVEQAVETILHKNTSTQGATAVASKKK